MIEYSLFQRLAFQQKYQGISQKGYLYLYKKARSRSVSEILKESDSISDQYLNDNGRSRKEIEKEALKRLFEQVFSGAYQNYVDSLDQKE